MLENGPLLICPYEMCPKLDCPRVKLSCLSSPNVILRRTAHVPICGQLRMSGDEAITLGFLPHTRGFRITCTGYNNEDHKPGKER